MAPPLWMDRRKASLNPCSLETIPEPVQLSDGKQVWPTMLSCYQLEDEGTRTGQLDMFLVSVPDIAGSMEPSLPLEFGPHYSLLLPSSSSGILDGKWSALPMESSEDSKTWVFATAHSTGEIRLHTLETDKPDPLLLDTESRFRSRFRGKSDTPPPDENGIQPLCLSLNWKSPAAYRHPAQGNPQIVSSYSNGKVSIHDVNFLAQSAQLVERDSWAAHHLFHTPTEVWSACFCGDLVVTGGDEGHVKFWDPRCVTRPIQVLQNHFDAGVTCVSPHPDYESIVAVGSYDETVALYDLRYLDQKKPLVHSKKLGGGIWRIKWHPKITSRMLVSAMHGGCAVLQYKGLQEALYKVSTESHGYETESLGVKVKVGKKFTEHQSMVSLMQKEFHNLTLERPTVRTGWFASIQLKTDILKLLGVVHFMTGPCSFGIQCSDSLLVRVFFINKLNGGDCRCRVCGLVHF